MSAKYKNKKSMKSNDINNKKSLKFSNITEIIFKKRLSGAEAVIFWITLLLVIFRIWLSYNTPIYLSSNLPHDATRMMEMTLSILKGEWLGEYNKMTLIKGMTYPLFASVCGFTRIPYSIFLSVFNIASAYIFVRSIKSVLRFKYIKYILFLLLVYSPITFGSSVVLIFYRNALTVPLVMFIFAGMFGIYLSSGNRKRGGYSVLAGISLFLFYNLREDSIWIFPFVICMGILILIFAAVSYKKTKNKNEAAKSTAFVILPFVLMIAGNLIICQINYDHYNIFAVNDRTHTAFNDVAGMFIKIDYDDSDEIDPMKCYLSYDKFEYIIDHSESLSKYKDEFLGAYTRWANGIFKDENIKGDHFQWAFRNGLSDAGLYETGEKTQEYLKKVKEELDQQVAEGNLKIKKGIFLSSSTKMIQLSEIPYFISKTFSYTVPRVISYNIESEVRVSAGDKDIIRKGEFVINSQVLYPDEGESIQKRFADKIVNMENNIISLYKFLAFPGAIAAAVSMVYLTVMQIFNIKKKNKLLFDRWIICCASLLSAIAMMLIFTVFSSWSALPINCYCCGASILIQIFEAIAIYSAAEALCEAVRLKKLQKKQQ